MTEPIWSHGGAGGVHAVLEDLDHAAGALGAAAAELADAARALAVAAHVAGWTPDRAPASPALAEAAAASSREADALDALAAALRAAATAYLEGEAAARQGVSLVGSAGEGVADWFGSVVWGMRTAIGMQGLNPLVGGVRDVGQPPTTGWMGRDEASGAVGLLGDHYGEVVAALAVALRQAEAWEPPYRAVAAGEPVEARAPDSLAQVMGRLAWLQAEGDGTVAIETVRGLAGTRHLVYVPGTEDWWVSSGNPADMQSNLTSVLGAWSDAARAVTDAIAAHGIPPEEPVLLAGHSQGGMVAAVVAAALADRFRDVRVVTAGSPTGRIALPTAVPALHLENTRDLVPGLDGRANPDRANRVTVSHDRRRSARPDAPDGSRTVAQAHGIDGYAATARLVDEGVSDSTRAWMAGAAPLLAGGRSTVTAYRPVTG
ncbi:hypothetical protein [Demequina phytophila]|uniref:hypothetical protein n=1 Tax=Demequina phytophila TaxID=1638981 RepID=UPI000A507D73|nr:hypothetical protein [Demequina phytophila]